MRLTIPATRILALDIETERAGSDWSDGKWKRKNFFCADMMYDEPHAEHMFLPAGFTRTAYAKWLKPLRTPGIVVVAHNARYDLDGINGHAVKLGLEPLPHLTVSDTCKTTKTGGMYSKALSYMCQLYHVKHKGSVSAYEWEQAYAGDRTIIQKVKEYNQNDVECTLELRKAMIAKGHLAQVYTWRA